MVNYRKLVIDSILNEGMYDANDITTYNFSEGGIPDLSGSSTGENAWDSPTNRKQNIYYEYYMIVLNDEEDNAKKTVVFVKCPPTMDGNLKVEKMQDFLRSELGYTKIEYSESIISGRIIRIINDYITEYGVIAELTGADVDDLVITPNISHKKEEKSNVIKQIKRTAETDKFVEKQMEDIKKQAYDLAKEKYDTLVSNGVNEELAKKAAKEAYMNFVMKFSKEKNKMMGGIKPKHVDNPLLHKNSRELIVKNREAKAKEEAMKLYRELIRNKKSKEYAKTQANKLYNKLK